jgi:integrase
VFFEGYAFVTLPSPGRWVTANGDNADAAKYAAIRKADEIEAEIRTAAAEEERRCLIAALTPKEEPTPEFTTVLEVLLDYNEYCDDLGRTDGTLKKYREHLSNFKLLTVDKFPGTVAEWELEDLRGKGFKRLALAIAKDERDNPPNSVRSRWGYLSSVFNYAVKMEYMKTNPMALVELPSREQKGEIEVTVEQVTGLMDLAEKDALMRAALSLAFAYGLRRQEIVGVTSDDLRSGKLYVTRQLARVNWDREDGPQGAAVPEEARYGRTKAGNTLVLKKPKSTRVKVEFKLTPELEAVFYASLDRAKPTVMWDAVERSWREVWFVVPAPEGGALEGHHLNERYRHLCDKMDVKGVLHDLRALFASDAVAKGTDVALVSQLLRHTDLATTQMYLRGLKGAVSEASRHIATSAGQVLGLSKFTTC